jgi:hypothetical protein
MTIAVIVYLYYSDEFCASLSPSETPRLHFESSCLKSQLLQELAGMHRVLVFTLLTKTTSLAFETGQRYSE